MLNVNRLECQVTLVAPVFLRTLEMEQSAQVCIHRMITVVTIKQNSVSMYYFAVPNPCLPTPCDPNAECIRESSQSINFTCSCLAPFTVGDGFNCSGKNEFLILKFFY